MTQISTYSYLALAHELNASLDEFDALWNDTSNEAAARIRI
jgi:hypothetical protein